MRKILVPVDGLDTCQKTFDTAASISDKFGAEIVVLYVKPTTEPLSHPGYVAMEEHSDLHLSDIAKRIVEEAVQKLSSDTRIVHAMVESGDPSSMIIDVAQRTECDMIVMCTHGMGAVKRFFMGSVTNKVVHHAKVPVLVVR